MNWQQLITNKRLGQEYRYVNRLDDRSEFKRDYDRLIFSLLISPLVHSNMNSQCPS